jgi:hypothetical protein
LSSSADLEETMQRRALIAGLGITTLGLPAPSAIAWDLVSPEDERQEDLITPPTIEVIRPDLAKPISGPATIQLAFRTQPGASILPSTFEATYGFLGLDITARLLQHAKLTPQGITAEDVSIPSGQHSITLSVADTMGRTAKRTFQVTVV